MEDIENMDSYRKRVRNAVDNDLDMTFPNESMKHARIIVEEFVRAAKKSVDIFCGRFSKDVYGDDPVIMGIFEDAIRNRKVRIRVLHCSPTVDSRDLARLIENNGEGNGVRYVVDPEIGNCCHFLVVDSKRYRIEGDVEKRAAVACANDVQMGMRLSNLFNEMFKLAAST